MNLEQAEERLRKLEGTKSRGSETSPSSRGGITLRDAPENASRTTDPVEPMQITVPGANDVNSSSPPVGETPTEDWQFADFANNMIGGLYRSARMDPTVGNMIKVSQFYGDRLAEEGPNSSGIEAGILSSLDAASMGNFDKAAAIEYGLRQIAQGKASAEELSEVMSDRQDAINYGLAENREAHKIATTVGAVAGSVATAIIPGGAIGKAYQGATWLRNSFVARNVIIPALAGGAEAALYRYNSDGTLEEIVHDAKVGAIGGAMFGTALGAGQSAYNRFVRNGGQKRVEEAIGAQLLRAISEGNQKLGALGDELPEAILQEIKSGNGKVLMDVYPELRGFAKAAMETSSDTAQGLAARQDLLDLIATRQAFDLDFNTALKDVLGQPRVRSLTEFSNLTSARQARLRPQYDAIFNGADQAGVSFKTEAIAHSAGTLLENSGKKLQRKVAGLIAENSTDGTMSMRQLHNFKRDLDPLIKAQLRDGKPVRKLNYIRQLVSSSLEQTNEDYAKLALTYGRAEAQEEAFKAGFKMMDGKPLSTDDIANFMQDEKSYASVSAFTQGARSRLYNDLAGKTPKQVQTWLTNNRGRLDNLAALMGKEDADALVKSVSDIVEKQQTLDVLKNARTPSNAGSSAGDNASGRDFMLALSGYSGEGSRSAAIGAISRLMGVSPFTSAQKDMASSIVANATTKNIAELPNILQRLQNMAAGKTQLPRQAAQMAGVGAGAQSIYNNTETPENQGDTITDPIIQDYDLLNMQQRLEDLRRQTE